VTTPDDKPTPEEEAAAEALARALDGEGGPDVPDEALQAAALLRYTGSGGELAPARRAALLDELMAEVDRSGRAPARARWRRWLLPWGGLAGAAAAMAVAFLLWPAGGAPGEAAALPAPTAALLGVQSAAARPGGGDLAALGREMRVYRAEMYAALAAHYGEDVRR
jgi:hypothetical protein